MSLPFDATVKDLVADHPHDFDAMFLTPRSGPVEILNVDLSTITAATDVAVGHGDPLEGITDWNFQASRDPGLVRRTLLYNTLLHYRHDVPVDTVLVLLRSKANDTSLDGRYTYRSETGGKVMFRYQVVRVWQIPANRLPAGGPGTLPLAVLAQTERRGRRGLDELVAQVIRRIEEVAPDEDERRLLTAAYTLLGLRVDRSVAEELFQKVPAMKESTTYQGILEDGREEGRLLERRSLILWQGSLKFGKPDQPIEERINQIEDRERLRILAGRILSADSWDELLEG